MLLKIEALCKSYKNQNSNSNRQVLKELMLEIKKGDKIAITGPSGSGKSTLLHLIGGLDKPDSGTILFEERNLNHFSRKEIQLFRNQSIGMVFQQHYLLPQLTLWENVLLPLLVEKSKLIEGKKHAEFLLKKMDLWEVKDQKPGELSGGENQRAAVARALINKPQLILADEPTGALDSKNSESLTALLLNSELLQSESLIVVTHSIKLAAQLDKNYTLEEGKLI